MSRILIRFPSNICNSSRVRLSFKRKQHSYGDHDHVYDNVIPWKSNEELADHICNNVVYDKNGVVIVNKPYGISFARDGPLWKKLEEMSKAGDSMKSILKHKALKERFKDVKVSKELVEDLATEIDCLNLSDAMPFIRKQLGNGIRPVRVPEKYTSGVAIFCRTDAAEKRVRKSWEGVRSLKAAGESYLTICSGSPSVAEVRNLRIGVMLDVSADGKQKKAILTTDYSRRAVLKSDVKLSTVCSQTLAEFSTASSSSSSSTSPLPAASLVRVDASCKKWHFIRLYLASYLMSPALGDQMFGSRVKSVMGVKVPVDQWNPASGAGMPQKLDRTVLERLGLEPGSEKYIPTMVHLSSVMLPRLLHTWKGSDQEDGSTLMITVPPPDHFVWTCARLGLRMPEEDDVDLPALGEPLNRFRTSGGDTRSGGGANFSHRRRMPPRDVRQGER